MLRGRRDRESHQRGIAVQGGRIQGGSFKLQPGKNTLLLGLTFECQWHCSLARLAAKTLEIPEYMTFMQDFLILSMHHAGYHHDRSWHCGPHLHWAHDT
jgi:hypothetical protein